MTRLRTQHDNAHRARSELRRTPARHIVFDENRVQPSDRYAIGQATRSLNEDRQHGEDGRWMASHGGSLSTGKTDLSLRCGSPRIHGQVHVDHHRDP